MARRDLDAVTPEMLRANRTNQTHDAPVRPKDTQPDPQAQAARVFDAALTQSGKTSDEVAFHLEVSASLVRRWRSPDSRETISTTQLFTLYRDLGPWFTWQYHVANHHEHKLAKLALQEALQALSLVGVGIE